MKDDLFERTFQTTRGPVDFLAEKEVQGDTWILKDVVVFGRRTSKLTGLTREALKARTQILDEVRAMGFKRLIIIGRRLRSSSSANPGHMIEISVDLT